MPIKKQQLGEHETTNVLFGTGDIGLLTCKRDEEHPLSMLILYQSTEKPLEEWDTPLIKHYSKGGTTDDMPTEGEKIVLEFTRLKSITQVIEMLQEIKAEMIEAQGVHVDE